LGLDPGWALNAIRAIGKYGEMWHRDMAATGLPRGLNKHWDQGGLLLAPRLR